MKLSRVVPVAVLLFVFTFTNLASAYSAPSLAALTTQLQGLLLQLNALLGSQYELTVATATTTTTTTTTTIAIPIAPRTCQINIYTRINGNEVYATTTMTGEITDQFAIGLSIATSSGILPYGKLVQTQVWGKNNTIGTAGYFTPAQYVNAKVVLANYANDLHYLLIPVALDNVYNVHTSNPAFPNTPYSEATAINKAIGIDIPAGKVLIRANVSDCTARVQGKEFIGDYHGVRTSQYTYVKYKTGEEELYDNVNDPKMQSNVAAIAGVGLLNVLRKWTNDLATCTGDACQTIQSENRLNGIGGALDGKACFFGGQQINNGASRTFYSATTSTPSCDAAKQVRTCTDGKLSGSDSYKYNSCMSLERFTGVNFNRHPENLDLALMNRTGANWMRANADILRYFRATSSEYTPAGWSNIIAEHKNAKTQYDYNDSANWKNFIDAHKVEKKGVVNIMWDFNRFGLRIPKASSTEEKELFKYLDVMLYNLLPSADIIVAGNEPFINTNSADWDNVNNPVGVSAPITVFYERVASHINDYMKKAPTSSPYARSKHKLFMGAFTNVDGGAIQGTRSVKDLLQFANETSYIDGIDIHTHVKTMAEMRAGFEFVSGYVPNKPITDTEYSYVFSMQQHFNDLLSANDTRPFENGMSFLQKYQNATATKLIQWRKSSTTTTVIPKGKPKYTATTTVRDYMLIAEKDPVSIEEWNDLLRSRSWTINHFLNQSKDIFKDYNVYGVTYQMGGVSDQNAPGDDLNLNNETPWFLTSLYTTGIVNWLLPRDGFPNGLPNGSYQYLNDFQTINKVPLTP